MSNHKTNGFTLIELMIVISIIGILATISISAYQNYLTKTKVMDVIFQSSNIYKKVFEAYISEGVCVDNSNVTPDSIKSRYAIPSSTELSIDYVSSILTAGSASDDGGCSVTTTFANSGINQVLQGKKLVWSLKGSNKDSPVWECYTNVPSSGYIFLPKNCQSAS